MGGSQPGGIAGMVMRLIASAYYLMLLPMGRMAQLTYFAIFTNNMLNNHPNRKAKNLDASSHILTAVVSFSPHPLPYVDPAYIRSVRLAAGLTQTEAALLIYSALRTWQQWEAGSRKMHPAMFELFEIKLRNKGGSCGFQYHD